MGNLHKTTVNEISEAIQRITVLRATESFQQNYDDEKFSENEDFTFNERCTEHGGTESVRTIEQ